MPIFQLLSRNSSKEAEKEYQILLNGQKGMLKLRQMLQVKQYLSFFFKIQVICSDIKRSMLQQRKYRYLYPSNFEQNGKKTVYLINAYIFFRQIKNWKSQISKKLQMNREKNHQFYMSI